MQTLRVLEAPGADRRVLLIGEAPYRSEESIEAAVRVAATMRLDLVGRNTCKRR